MDVSLLAGRWVRSDSQLDDWDRYTGFFGLDASASRRDAVEPEVHVITRASREGMTMVQQRQWQNGFQAEISMKIDGQAHPLPRALLKTGHASFAASRDGKWTHRFEDSEGSECLLCEQHLLVGGKTYTLRERRSFVSARELRLAVCISEGDAEVVRAARYFHRAPFKASWTAATVQFYSGMDVAANLVTCVGWMRKARAAGADLIVLPENANRDRQYFKNGKPDRKTAWDMCETLDGPFVSGLRAACAELGLWCCAGVDLRAAKEPEVYVGQVLIRPDGEIEGQHNKHVLWDYEYTLFVPGDQPYQVFDTELGRLAMIVCADGITPETTRSTCLMGTQVLLNSLNSRGPDEGRVHIPLRSIENRVWHVASNTVGNPNNVGLLWPWTGGSQICDPSGQRIVASEDAEEMIVGEVRPWEAEDKSTSWTEDLLAQRRPELYGALTRPLADTPVAAMYGPAPPVGSPLPFDGPATIKAAMMQLSFTHTRPCTEWMTQRQVAYAAHRKAVVGVLPELWCFRRGEVAADPAAAAEYSARVLSLALGWAKDHAIFLSFSLVEAEAGKLYHTAFLVGPEGVVLKYRKAHLNSSEAAWATPGDALCPVAATQLGRVALMLGDEVWVPEVGRCLAIEGVEIVLHPCDWDRKEAAEMAATECAGQSRFHLVSVTRLDCAGKVGSQTTLAGEFVGGEPIPLMRYAQGVWCRHNVEEQILVSLERRHAHCKMMGDHLDVLEKRYPELAAVCTWPKEDLYHWRSVTDARPADYPDVFPYQRGALGTRKRALHQTFAT